jgi:hypothetical protein
MMALTQALTDICMAAWRISLAVMQVSPVHKMAQRKSP